MIRFFRDLKTFFIAEIKRYYLFKERILWDSLFPIIGLFSFILIWRAVINTGFQGLGDLRPDNYVMFILMGNLLWQIISSSLGGLAHVMVDERYSRTLTYVFLSPANKISYLYAKSARSLMRFIITNLIMLFFASLFFDISIKGNIISIILIFALSYISFSAFGLIFSALGGWRDGFADLAWVISSVLYLLSGVQYPIEVFPESIRRIVLLLPTTQALNAVRAVSLHAADIYEILPQIVYLIILGIVSFILLHVTFKWLEKKISLVGV
ncbi:MAG: ABC transporter permease [Candidatus Aenigmarchaeota archaeon]|nr:ABC transporter permease [Candidatus Aenigmarchaeota archaeon]